jgi:ABC-type uncharacterized transport system ATPase subunit
LRLGKLIYDGSVDRLLADNLRQSYWLTMPTGEYKVSTPLINREQLNADLVRWEVTSSNKDNLVKELVGQGVSIQGLKQVRPSLEEIFYQIRS